MQNGTVIFAKGYGLANTADQRPRSRPRRSSRIGSVTKQFTCAVALQLEQEGQALVRRSDRQVRPGADPGRRHHRARHRRDGVGLPRLLPARLRRSADGGAAAERRDRQGLRVAAARLRAALPLLLQQHRLPAARAASPRSPAASRSPPPCSGGSSRRSASSTPATSRRAAARAWPRATRRSGWAPPSRRFPEGDGLDRRRRRHLVDAVGPAALGPGADGRQGAVAGGVRHDEHAAPADRRPHAAATAAASRSAIAARCWCCSTAARSAASAPATPSSRRRVRRWR